MPTSAPSGDPAAGRRLVLSTVLVLVLLVPIFAGSGIAAPTTPRASPAATTGAAANDVQVTADGKPTAGSGSVSSAVVVSLATPVNVTFTYSTKAGAAPASLTVAVARLQLIVFDVAAGVKEVDLSDVHPTTSGAVSVIGDYSYARYLVEGAYEMHALLLDPNGSTLFSETFFIKVHTAYDLTVINALFGILVLYELYTVATLGSAKSVLKLVKSAEAARKGGSGGAP